MAGLGQLAFAQHPPLPPSHHALPTGPCNHRDVVGTCGCRQFWDKCSAHIHENSKERRSSSERSTYCVCGHHACFHEAAIAPAPARAPACDNHNPATHLLDEASQANGSVDEQGHDGSSLSSTTGLPRVPSVCLLSNDRYPAANHAARSDAKQSRQTIAGLGLSMLNVGTTQPMNDGQQSVTSTEPDDIDIQRQLQKPHGELHVPVSRDSSAAVGQQSLTCSAAGPLDAVIEYNQMLHLDVCGDTIPNTYNPEDIIQSATEVATPSPRNTPDLALADQAVHDGKRFIEGLMRLSSHAERGNSPNTRPATAASAPTPKLLMPNSPHSSSSQEQLHNALRSASPQALQKLVSYLTPLHNLLSAMPNVANTMREHSDRISMLENNNSFNYVHPDDVQQTFDGFDGRILHLENRMDDHDVLHQAIDADQSSLRRGRELVAESFGSHHSIQSTTSSALIVAALDRKEVATEIGSIKDRLEVLEAAALPTSLNPWEVEVVLLPWGRDLRGVWFSPDEPMHNPSHAITQDTEEWTQARSSALAQPRTSLVPFRDTDSSPHPATRSPRSSHPFSDTDSGWSSQEISEWASGSSDELLAPKACGSNNLVYKRLKSRGFAVDVKLTNASAMDIQATISHAFKGFLERFKYNEEDENAMTNAYPGLRASFIPLRKVIRDSRLRFLTPSEMASSALWSAQFLASGVLMRVSGGKKRLYVTQREAYIQPTGELDDSWTWQRIRLLPRRQADSDSQMEGNEERCQPQVPEADAREACWAFFEAYDAPPVASINSSFASQHSVQLSMRPADRGWRRSMTPSSILKNRQPPQPPQPISPLSEFHPQRPMHHRTVSASVIEPTASTSSKRRLNTSPVKQSSAPQTQSRMPSNVTSRLKRRRVTNSYSPQPEVQEAQTTIWANTPRRSRESQSPFFSSEPQLLPLPRTGSDLTSRPSQRSLAAMGKSTPGPYATPYSGAFGADHPFADDGAYEGEDHHMSNILFGNRGFEDEDRPEYNVSYNNGGLEPEGHSRRKQTVPGDDLYQDDDGEPSWRGLTTGEDDSGSGSGSDDNAKAGVEMEAASFSGDGSTFDSEDDDDGDSSVNEGADDEDEDEGEDENDDDIYDTLLGVLQN
ncbi:hypothetical protein CC80DRAFT_588004 [Byssothecium circinans]|uniref:Uncharacterized protein n=1 Tax=Byssothecium circinans TaxID=147558 RepID=A0A6A5UFE9_9PLEO|nr:hypothetical protein CC80DRAFT_588004 [Byssothecium circinans]